MVAMFLSRDPQSLGQGLVQLIFLTMPRMKCMVDLIHRLGISTHRYNRYQTRVLMVLLMCNLLYNRQELFPMQINSKMGFTKAL